MSDLEVTEAHGSNWKLNNKTHFLKFIKNTSSFDHTRICQAGGDTSLQQILKLFKLITVIRNMIYYESVFILIFSALHSCLYKLLFKATRSTFLCFPYFVFYKYKNCVKSALFRFKCYHI